jgi:hypothetical protein
MAARTAVVAGTATAVSGRVARRQQGKYATQDASYNQQQAVAMEQGVAQAAPMPAAPAQPDMTAELKNIADLHASGALTDEEFASAKAKVLGT